MIRVILWQSNHRRTGFCVSGHAGYAPASQDIVCAAVSSAVRLCEKTLSRLGAVYTASVDRKRNLVSILSSGPVTDAFAELMRELSEEYPEYISVTEVRYV